MYFIRMMLFWLVLIARCSGSDEIPLKRAEQASTFKFNGKTFIAAWAIDNDLGTYSSTARNDRPAWLRVHFTSRSTVERVVVERGMSPNVSCVFTVSVYDGAVRTECGTYTGKPEG